MSFLSEGNLKKEMICRILLFRILFHKIKKDPVQDSLTGILSSHSPVTLLDSHSLGFPIFHLKINLIFCILGFNARYSRIVSLLCLDAQVEVFNY